jgi:hypothetical protein
LLSSSSSSLPQRCKRYNSSLGFAGQTVDDFERWLSSRRVLTITPQALSRPIADGSPERKPRRDCRNLIPECLEVTHSLTSPGTSCANDMLASFCCITRGYVIEASLNLTATEKPGNRLRFPSQDSFFLATWK